jgi:hypothetical protein
MTWDVHLCKAPAEAIRLDDVPDGYGGLGKVADVVERLRSIVPGAWLDTGTVPGAWFEDNEKTGIWGGVECDAYSLRIYLHTSEDGADPEAPVKATDNVESVLLAFQPAGDPHRDMDHPVWDFIADACRALECRAEDDTWFLGPDGRPAPAPDRTSRPWWRFWG